MVDEKLNELEEINEMEKEEIIESSEEDLEIEEKEDEIVEEVKEDIISEPEDNNVMEELRLKYEEMSKKYNNLVAKLDSFIEGGGVIREDKTEEEDFLDVNDEDVFDTEELDLRVDKWK